MRKHLQFATHRLDEPSQGAHKQVWSMLEPGNGCLCDSKLFSHLLLRGNSLRNSAATLAASAFAAGLIFACNSENFLAIFVSDFSQMLVIQPIGNRDHSLVKALIPSLVSANEQDRIPARIESI
jgi:hypothetical protein